MYRCLYCNKDGETQEFDHPNSSWYFDPWPDDPRLKQELPEGVQWWHCGCGIDYILTS